MLIVKMMGGLGNQMFSYAFALALRKRGREVKLDATWYERCGAHNGWELPDVFGIDIPLCTIEERDRLGDFDQGFPSRLRRKLFGERAGHLKERRPGYDPTFLDIDDDLYLDGFWQSPRYHKDVESEIESAFAFSPDLEPEARSCLSGASGRSIIGVHVRRGDFLTSELLYGVCTQSYYEKALQVVCVDARDPLVLFFSDDLDWCRDSLARGRDAIYVDWNRGFDSWKDMRLMTRCDRLVIANSSFSWWGARLGKPEQRIFAPRRWIGGTGEDNTDIAMPTWVRIDS